MAAPLAIPGLDFTLGDLDLAPNSLINNGNATIPIWDPEAEDTFQIRLQDLFPANGGILRAVRTIAYGSFLQEANAGGMLYGRQTLVIRAGKNNVLVTEAFNKLISPMAIEFIMAKTGIIEEARLVKYNVQTDTVSVLSLGGDGEFDGTRAVKTMPQLGQVYGGATTSEWINNAYFGFLAAQIGLGVNSTVFEYGTTFDVSLVAVINPQEETEISNRQIKKGQLLLASSEQNTFQATDTITQATTYTVSANVGGNGNPGIISSTQIVSPVLPIYYGVASENLAGSRAYVQANGTKKLGAGEFTMNITANAQRIFVSVPVSFGQVREVVDADGGNILGGFNILPSQNFLFGSNNEVIPYRTIVLSSDYTGTNVPFIIRH